MNDIFSANGILGGDSLGLDFNLGNPVLDILATAGTIYTTNKLVEKMTGSKETALLVAGATGWALTTDWNPMQSVWNSFNEKPSVDAPTVPTGTAGATGATGGVNAPAAPASPTAAPNAPASPNAPAAPTSGQDFYQAMMLQSQQQSAENRRMMLESQQTTEKASRNQLIGGALSGIGQGLIADRTAKTNADSERDLLERKYQLEREAAKEQSDPAAFDTYSAQLAANPQPLAYTQLKSVGGTQVANDEVANQIAKYKAAISQLQQQRGMN